MNATSIRRMCTALETMLEKEEKRRGALSVLCSGAAFESWLSFETRLMLEHGSAQLGMENHVVLNEFRKCDLYIEDQKGSCCTLEFKILYNNGNSETQIARVFDDLQPRSRSKAEMQLAFGPVAIVGLVGKMYKDRTNSRFKGANPDVESWRREVVQRIRGGAGAMPVKHVWTGKVLPTRHRWFDDEFPSFFQLHAFVRG